MKTIEEVVEYLKKEIKIAQQEQIACAGTDYCWVNAYAQKEVVRSLKKVLKFIKQRRVKQD